MYTIIIIDGECFKIKTELIEKAKQATGIDDLETLISLAMQRYVEETEAIKHQ